jgi:hypothetical protein
MTATVIRDLFGPEITDRFRTYLDEVVPISSRGRDDLFSREWIHNPEMFRIVHIQLADFASEIFGERVKPSYCFLSLYGEKGICPIHIDRPQCRYTIDYLIAQDGTEPWPIYISDPLSEIVREEVFAKIDPTTQPTEDQHQAIYDYGSGWTEYLLQPNDAVCYSGTHSIHYRDRIRSRSASLIFWHFVPEAFDGSLA